MSTFNSLLVIANPHKPLVPDALKQLTVWAIAHDMRMKVYSTTSKHNISDCDVCVSLGGDGTLMLAAQVCCPIGLPILAVNLGSLGFHTQAEYEDLENALTRLHTGEFTIAEHIILEACLPNGEKRIAINDIVLAKELMGHMLHVKIEIDDEYVSHLSADALVISTPFGSTAYNFAAGGPILFPGVHGISLVAVCPHKPGYFSPIVLPKNKTIKVIAQARTPVEHSHIIIDGQSWCRLSENSQLQIKTSNNILRLIDFGSGYFEKLRSKLSWGTQQ